jgi:UDP-N-acetylmuramyl pentapeptide synthase
MVFLFGEETRLAADVMRTKGFFHTQDRAELSRALDDYVRPGDLVLLKGSRGCELETLTEILVGDTHGL